MDQASGLRAMQRQHTVKVIAVTGGKGGVGKTSLTVNLAYALAKSNKRVLILDADLGLANIDIMLGIHAQHNLSDVVLKGYTFQDVLCQVRPHVYIIPASSGIRDMVNLSAHQYAGLIQAFSALEQQFDYLLIDTAAGISDMVLNFAIAAQETLVVVCDEPTSITDAYALMKVLCTQHDQMRFHIVTNMIKDLHTGQLLYQKLAQVAHRFLDVTTHNLAHIPFDPVMRKAIRQQKLLLEAYPQSLAAQKISLLANKISRWPHPSGPHGKLEFFIESICQIQPEKQILRDSGNMT